MAKKSNDAAFRWIFERTEGHRAAIVLISAANAVYASCSAVFALMCKGIIDGAINKDQRTVVVSGVILAGIVVLQTTLHLIISLSAEKTRARMEISLRRELLRQLMGKETAKLSGYHSGELQNRIFSDTAVVVDGVIGVIPACVNTAFRIICAAAALVILDPWFALILVTAGALIFITALSLRRKIKGLHKTMQEKEGAMRSVWQETIEGLHIIKVFGSEEKMQRLCAEKQEEHFSARMKRRRISAFAGAGFGAVFSAGYLATLLWGAFGILFRGLGYGTLTAMLQLVNQVQSPFAGLSSLLPRLYGAAASAERLIETESLPDEPPAEKTLSYAGFSRAELHGVSFSYGENHVLSDVDIRIDKGDLVSLTGISGGGKSTLFLLLLGAYTPQSGDIVFRSAEGDYSAGRETRGMFAYVPQGNMLFSGTIADNIAFLKDGASPEEIRGAAKTACALEFIEALPDGFDTRIGEKGAGISEGQAQRIAVARALLGGGDFLLLDEATSALDENTEAELLRNLSRLDGKTVVMVTHRKAALSVCKKHLMLKDGRITEE